MHRGVLPQPDVSGAGVQRLRRAAGGRARPRRGHDVTAVCRFLMAWWAPFCVPPDARGLAKEQKQTRRCDVILMSRDVTSCVVSLGVRGVTGFVCFVRGCCCGLCAGRNNAPPLWVVADGCRALASVWCAEEHVCLCNGGVFSCREKRMMDALVSFDFAMARGACGEAGRGKKGQKKRTKKVGAFL